MYVHDWLGISARYPTAIAAWTAATQKHAGDKNPPAGVPVFFAPNHVALSIGGGNIVSTDWPRSGHIGKTTIQELSKAWSHIYLGWTGDLNGHTIGGIGNATVTPTVPSNNGGTVSPAGLPSLGGIGTALTFLTDSSNWMRLAYFVAGTALILFAFWQSAPAMHALTTTAKKVGQYAASGS
jgi:hypothetical protein